MNFVRSSLKYKQVTLSILGLFFILGVYALLEMPRREDPKITIPMGLVVAYYPGANSAQVEEQLTKKIEKYLFQFSEVNKAKTTSKSIDGMSVVEVVLMDNVKQTDVFWNKLRHQMLITKQIDLPKGVIGPIVNSDFGDTEAVLISISSKKAQPEVLKQYAQQLEDKLRTIPAASKIKRVGDLNEQVTIAFESAKLSEFGISIADVVKIIQSQNEIYPSGQIEMSDYKTPIYTTGYYTSEEDLGNQIVGASNNGAVVKLKDIANIKREKATPTSKTFVNGQDAIIISVQMHEGNNIVNFGKNIQSVLDDFQKNTPADIIITDIANQPKVVEHNISHFIREFFLAIVAVVVVVMLLLPFRIATVAAMAIPMTVAVTLAVMNFFGIELHQVSLAALIVVLGMVVDDAIVVADNYVELLDKGVERWEAAWRSAYDLIIPILVATVTIIASFFPMVFLTGAIGEFIIGLPQTVMIALTSSFVVAMVFTPILCYLFIKKGLHSEEKKQEKFSFLDKMQNGYNKVLNWCVKNPKITLVGSLIPIILAGLLMKFVVKQKFFPEAERNQFVVELWMPTGSQLEATETAIRKVEGILLKDERVTSVATFVGQSAPRFYYNFSPEVPVSNYAQIMINTTTDKTTEELSKELKGLVQNIIPEGIPEVRLMQQGQPLKSSVEVRIKGEDINMLKKIASQVDSIILSTNKSTEVRNDFKEDYLGVKIDLKPEAERLGFTTESISKMVYTGFTGAPITTIHEGDNDVKVIFTLNENNKNNTTDLRQMYVTSPITGANVPLLQVANIVPTWHTGRIMHRNGIKTLTVQTDAAEGYLPSELAASISPLLDQLNLPNGYQLEFGGEYANQAETLGQMVGVLLISLVLIFFILLLQFKDVKEVLIVMSTIPLSIFGAILGLVITGNNFGFTAFIGLISLSGVVVRNAIILIDHTNELMEHEGMDLKTASIESGQRRLRPIFLTAMAAAIGVLPMIISGSPMWSPLASVIAVGVIWSMIMALLTVPVLCIMWLKNKKIKKGISVHVTATILIIASFSFIGNKANAQETLTLSQVINAGLEKNELLNIREYQYQEQLSKVRQAKWRHTPSLTVSASYMHIFNLPRLDLKQGSLIPNVFPATDIKYPIGNHNMFNAGAMLYMPLTQHGLISMGTKIAKTDVSIAEIEKKKAAKDLSLGIEKLYYGILISRIQQDETKAKIKASEAQLTDVNNALEAGKTLSVNTYGLQAAIALEEQSLLNYQFQEEDYVVDLKKLTNIDASIHVLTDAEIGQNNDATNYSTASLQGNYERTIAELQAQKAKYAVKATELKYMPNIGLIGGYMYQNGIDILEPHNPIIGINFMWNIQDIFINREEVIQRKWVVKLAEEKLAYQTKDIESQASQSVRKVQQAKALIEVAEKGLQFRQEEFKINQNAYESGLITAQKLYESEATLAQAKSDLYKAKLNYLIMIADLNQIINK